MFVTWSQVWKIRERLYLGNYWSGEKALLGQAIPTEVNGDCRPFAGVVSLCPVPLDSAEPLIGPINPATEWLHLPIADGGSGEGEFEAVCDLAIPFILRTRRCGNVLVHCTAGMSRSVSLIAAVLCTEEPGMDVATAYAEVAKAKGRALGIEPIEFDLLIAPAWEFRVHLRQRFERNTALGERSATLVEKN
jgi:protein-tyrosine phosphatase